MLQRRSRRRRRSGLRGPRPGDPRFIDASGDRPLPARRPASEEPSRAAFNCCARRRQDQQEPHHVRQETRRQQERAAEEDQGAVGDLAGRHPAAPQGGLQAAPGGLSLPLQEPRAEHGDKDEKADRRQNADPLPHLDDDVQLHYRNHYQSDQDGREHALSICYPYAVIVTASVKELSFSAAMRHLDEGAAFVDLRPVDEYLDVHIAGSLSLLYESGPGFQSRARDCIPLSVPLVLLSREGVDPAAAAAALRGRGFDVPGFVSDGVTEWSKWYGTPASTETYHGPRPRHGVVLHVNDPGRGPVEDAIGIPIEHLWGRVDELQGKGRIVVAAGRGVRAALAVGILERAGIDDIVFWREG